MILVTAMTGIFSGSTTTLALKTISLLFGDQFLLALCAVCEVFRLSFDDY